MEQTPYYKNEAVKQPKREHCVPTIYVYCTSFLSVRQLSHNTQFIFGEKLKTIKIK